MITQNGRYYENGQWVTTGPLEIHKDLTYPNIGPRDSYLLYHEEFGIISQKLPDHQTSTFLDDIRTRVPDPPACYPKHRHGPHWWGRIQRHENRSAAIPESRTPQPQDLGENYEGETSIGCRIRGLKDGKEHTYYIYNNCSHQEAYKETGMQGVSYTTGVPAMIGAMMFLKGLWKRPGVWNVEEFDPDPFMEQLNKQGLPWHEVIDGNLEV